MNSYRLDASIRLTIRTAGWRNASALFVAVLLVMAPTMLPAQITSAFSEELAVGKTALLVDAARALSASQLRALRAEEVIVLIDGLERRVTRLEVASADAPATHAADGCGWTFLVYVDAVLADPATVVDAAVAVAQRSDEFVRMGCVEVVLADPLPRVLLSATRWR